MLRYLIPFSLSALLFACNEESDDSSPGSADMGSSGDVSGGSDDGSSGGDADNGGNTGAIGEEEDEGTGEDVGGGEKQPLLLAEDPCDDDEPSEDEDWGGDSEDHEDEERDHEGEGDLGGLLDDLLGGDDEGDEDLLDELLGDDDENDSHDEEWQDDEDDVLDVLEFDDEGNLFCGCGDEEGLYRWDEDEGEFELVEGFESSNVFNIFLGESGDLYISGMSESSFLSRIYSSGEDGDGDGELDLLSESMLSLGFNLEAQYAEDSCGDSSSLSLSGDYETLLWSDGLLGYSSDDWDEDQDELTGSLFSESRGHLMFSLAEHGGECWGVGQSEDGHPAIYEEDEGLVLGILFESMTTLVIEDREGHFTDIESQGDGGVWVVGEDSESGEGMAYWCESDCGEAGSWDELDLSLDLGLDAELTGRVTDIDFDDSGEYGCMVGEQQGSEEHDADGGWASCTDDGGQTWQSIDEEMPQMDNCSVDSDGDFALSGALGFVLMGNVTEHQGGHEADGVEDVD